MDVALRIVGTADTKQIEALEERIKSLGPALSRAFKGDAAAKAATDFKHVSKAVGDAGEAAEKSRNKFDGLGVALAAATGAGTALVGIQALTSGISGVASVLGDAISVGMSFEKQLSAISAVSGATAEEMALVHDKALQLGKDTAFSAMEAAAGMEELLKAGVDVEGVLGGAADAAVALAAAGGVDLAKAAEIAANSMNVFGLSAKELPAVADLIAGAANASAISVEDFGMSLAASGAVANLAGFSIEELAVGITAMGNAGIKGSDAGTSMKTFMSNLIPTTNTQADAFMDLGIKTAEAGNKFLDATGNMRPMQEIAGVLQEALVGLSESEKMVALEAMFGSDAIRAAAIVAETGAEGWANLTAEMGKVSAADVAAERLNNVQGAADAFGGSLETLKIVVVEKLLPSFTDMIQAGSDVLNKFTEFASTKQFQDFIKEIGEKAAAFVTGAGNKLMEFVSDLIEAMKPPPGDTVVDRMRMAGENISSKGVDDMRSAIDKARDAFDNIGPSIQTIGDFLEDLGKWLDENKVLLKSATVGVDFLRAGFDRFGGIMRTFNVIAKAGGLVLDEIKKALSDLGTSLGQMDLGKMGKDLIDGLWKGIRDAWNGMMAGFKDLLALLPQWAKDILGIASPSTVFESIGTDIMLGLALGIQFGGQSAEDAMTAAIARVNVSAREELARLDQGIRDFYGRTFGEGGTWEKLFNLWTSRVDNDLNTMDFGHIAAKDLPKPPDWRVFAGDPEAAKKAWDKFWNEMSEMEEKRNRATVGERLPDDAEGRHYSGLLRLEHKYSANPEMTEAVERMKKIEKNRHDLAMKYIAEERDAGAKLWKERQEQIELENKLREEARRLVQAAQQAAEKREELISATVLEHINAQAKEWEKAHKDRMAGFEAEKVAAEKRHADALAGFAAERKAQTDYLAAWEAGVKKITDEGNELGVKLGRLKLDLNLDAEKDKLDGLSDRLSAFEDALGKLDAFDPGDAKGAAQRAAKAAKEKIKLTTDAQRAMLESVRGTLTGDDARTAELLMQGHALKATRVRDLMTRIGEQIKGQIGAQQGVIDAKQAQIDALQSQIDLNKQLGDEAGLAFEKEKARVQLILDAIDKRATDELAAHEATMTDIAKRSAAEVAAYGKLTDRIEEMRTAEAKRHTDTMRQIGEEYAMRLALLDHTPEEIAAMVAAAAEDARKIGEEAAKLFGELGGTATEAFGKVSAGAESAATVVMALNNHLSNTVGLTVTLATGFGAVALKIGEAVIELAKFAGEAEKVTGDAEDGPPEMRTPNFAGKRERGGYTVLMNWWKKKQGEASGETGKGGPGGTGGPFSFIGEGAKNAGAAVTQFLVTPIQQAVAETVRLTEAWAKFPYPVIPPGPPGGGGDVPNPWRYSLPPRGDEPNPWRYGIKPGPDMAPGGLTINSLDLTIHNAAPEIRVYIGDREIKDVVVKTFDDRTAAFKVESKLADVRAVKSSRGPTT